MSDLVSSLITEAWFNLQASRGRSLITMLGIVWGIASVVIFLAMADGVETGITATLGELASDVVIVRAGQTSKGFSGSKPGKPITLTPQDAGALRRQAWRIEMLSPEVTQARIYQFDDRSFEMEVCGVEPAYAALHNMQMAEGRFLNGDDLRQQRKFVVLGDQIKQRLFRNQPAVGQDIRIGGIRFTVVGILKDRTNTSRFSAPDNRRGFIPFASAGYVMNTQELSSIVLQPVSTAVHTAAIEQVRTLLAQRHQFSPADQQAVDIWDVMETVNLFRGMVLGIKGINIFLGILTLLISGVGVMNVMLVAVAERTGEIGLRKAIGARRRDVLVQFIAEALVITMTAGAVGILLGVILCLIIPPVPMPFGQTKLEPHATSIAIAFAILFAVGFLSGVAPAVRAARLHPVEALRQDTAV